MIRIALLASILMAFASAVLAAEQPAVAPPAPAAAPAAAPVAPPAVSPVAPPPAPRPPAVAPAPLACKPLRRSFPPYPTLVPAKCDAQGRLACRQFSYGNRNVTITRIIETDGVVKEVEEQRSLGYGPMMYDTVFEAKDLCLFGIDGKPIDPQTLPARLAQWTPVLLVDWGKRGRPARCVGEDIESGAPLLQVFRDDLVLIVATGGHADDVSERAVKSVPPSPPKPVRVRMDEQGRLVFYPPNCDLEFAVTPATAPSPAPAAPPVPRKAESETPQPSPALPHLTTVKAIAIKCDRFALSPELVSVFDSNGEPVEVARLPQLLANETTALVCWPTPAACPAPAAAPAPPAPAPAAPPAPRKATTDLPKPFRPVAKLVSMAGPARDATSEPAKPFEPFYLRAVKPGTLLFVLPFQLPSQPETVPAVRAPAPARPAAPAAPQAAPLPVAPRPDPSA